MEEKDHATTYLKHAVTSFFGWKRAGTGYKAVTQTQNVLCSGKAVNVISIKTYEQIYWGQSIHGLVNQPKCQTSPEKHPF